MHGHVDVDLTVGPGSCPPKTGPATPWTRGRPRAVAQTSDFAVRSNVQLELGPPSSFSRNLDPGAFLSPSDHCICFQGRTLSTTHTPSSNKWPCLPVSNPLHSVPSPARFVLPSPATLRWSISDPSEKKFDRGPAVVRPRRRCSWPEPVHPVVTGPARTTSS